jgi:hypothetical protein
MRKLVYLFTYVGCLIHNRTLSLTILENRSPRSRQIQCLVRAHCLVHTWILLRRRGQLALLNFFYKDTIPNDEALLPYPSCFPKPLPPNTVNLGIRISTNEFGETGQTNTQTIASNVNKVRNHIKHKKC